MYLKFVMLPTLPQLLKNHLNLTYLKYLKFVMLLMYQHFLTLPQYHLYLMYLKFVMLPMLQQLLKNLMYLKYH